VILKVPLEPACLAVRSQKGYVATDNSEAGIPWT